MVRHHPPGVLRIISKPAHLRPAAVIHRPQFSAGRVRVAPAARRAVHPGMPGRVSAIPPPAGYRYRHRILYRRAACRGKPEKRKQNGDRQGKIKTWRAVYGILPPAVPVWSAPGENGGPRRPSPRHRARHITLRRPVKGQRPPEAIHHARQHPVCGRLGGSTSSAPAPAPAS